MLKNIFFMEDSAKKFSLMLLNKLCITCMNIYILIYTDIIQYLIFQSKNILKFQEKLKHSIEW